MRGLKAWAALLALALAAAGPPLAAAECTWVDQTTSNFALAAAPGRSTATRACFVITGDRPCTEAAACCGAAAPYIGAVFMSVPAKCSKRRVARKITVSQDGDANRPAARAATGLLNLQVRGNVAGAPVFCVDVSELPECPTIAALCPGGSCQLQINTFVMKSQSLECCIQANSGPLDNGGNSPTPAPPAPAPPPATGPGAFEIKLINVGTNTDYDSIFQAAKAKWESIIVADIPNIKAQTSVDLSYGNYPGGFYSEVDDLVIFYAITKIDGPGAVLGSAGPLYLRSDGTRLPITGMMKFDQEDLARNPNQDYWRGVILHEMGHVLGVGTLWGLRGCISSVCPSNGDATDPLFLYQCAAANREYSALSCGTAVPIETEMGAGSACGHWREKTLWSELMTPRASGALALSRITIGAIEDLYGAGSVDYSKADPYTCGQRLVGPESTSTAPAEDLNIRPTTPEVLLLPGATEKPVVTSSIDPAFLPVGATLPGIYRRGKAARKVTPEMRASAPAQGARRKP